MRFFMCKTMKELLFRIAAKQQETIWKKETAYLPEQELPSGALFR